MTDYHKRHLMFDPSFLRVTPSIQDQVDKLFKNHSILNKGTEMNSTELYNLEHGAIPTRVEQITAPRFEATKQLHMLIDLVKTKDDQAADLLKQAQELKVKHDEAASQAKKARAELLKTHGVKL